MMSALADLSATDSSYNGTYFNVYANTFTNAPKTQGHTNFLNNFYDDEGWWGIAWLNIYDLTQNPNYLNMAKTIFNDMHGGWTTPCGGGIYWEKGQPYIASIANGMSLVFSASLTTLSANSTRTVHPTGCRTRQPRAQPEVDVSRLCHSRLGLVLQHRRRQRG